MPVPATTKAWTLEELHSLPDDGNKYELVRGELFVTPAPTVSHETIAARLTRLLDPYIAANNLGFVYHPRAVMQFEGSQVEPDLMVQAPHPSPATGWATAPTPILVVEILSPTTRRRDQVQKRSLYLDAGVTEYWIVDPEARTVRVARRDTPDAVAQDEWRWAPDGTRAPLVLRVQDVFGEA